MVLLSLWRSKPDKITPLWPRELAGTYSNMWQTPSIIILQNTMSKNSKLLFVQTILTNLLWWSATLQPAPCLTWSFRWLTDKPSVIMLIQMTNWQFPEVHRIFWIFSPFFLLLPPRPPLCLEIWNHEKSFAWSDVRRSFCPVPMPTASPK